MSFQSIIRCKRDGQILNAADISSMVTGITNHQLSDAQLAAFGMAIYLNDLSIAETVNLTRAMRDSGHVIQWDLPGPVMDKHSTGGVGDMVSLLLGPVLAACGCYVPMISGRALGHTGGTIDKLESISGYNVTPGNASFKNCVAEAGLAIVGQTEELAPADQRFYAIRDESVCVESVPLICASILAKKMAAGVESLVMDIKVGNGAFMPDKASARALADTITAVAQQNGLKLAAMLSDMNSPLANSVGNALEIMEVVEFLRGDRQNPQLLELSIRLAAESLLLAGHASHPYDASKQAKQALDSGAAAEHFAKMVSYLGGPSDLLDRPNKCLATATIIKPVLSEKSGFITDYQTRNIGELVRVLGASKDQHKRAIDHSVGLSDILPLGSSVELGDPLVIIHASSEQDWQSAATQFVQECIIVSELYVAPAARIIECRYAPVTGGLKCQGL